MADKKISQLTGATTPLGGTEEVPLVQSSTTKKVTVANLTAGRSVAAASFQANGRIVYGATAIYDVPGPTGNNTGLSFSGNLYLPVDGTGTLTNGVVSIGSSSYRYNDIHIAGNVIPGTAAKGVNFTANTPAAGMTSQLLNWYEEGTWTPTVAATSGSITSYTASGTYTRVGRLVTLAGSISITNNGTGTGGITISSVPFSILNTVAFGVAREGSVNGKTSSITASAGTQLIMYTYDNNYPGATGATFQFGATYFV